MITPKTTPPSANAVYLPSIMVGMRIVDGVPRGVIYQLVYEQAVVDANGVWTPNGVRGTLDEVEFGFDAQGNVTDLPTDLAPLAGDIAAAWQTLVGLADSVNAIREIV